MKWFKRKAEIKVTYFKRHKATTRTITATPTSLRNIYRIDLGIHEYIEVEIRI